MPVITISRQTGSGGATIGHQVAERLHADYLNTQIIHLVAERLGISEATAAEHNERAEAFGERLTHVLATLDPSLAALSRPVPPLPVESTTTAFVAVTRELVQAAAALEAELGSARGDAGRLATALDDFAMPGNNVYAVYPERRLLPAKVKFFIEFMKKTFGDPPYWE
jgi:DNA-binding transcriptional LysR family regulator